MWSLAAVLFVVFVFRFSLCERKTKNRYDDYQVPERTQAGLRSHDRRVLEIVEVLPVDDIDRHFAGQPYQLADARIRHDSDRQLLAIARHSAIVQQYEGAAAAVQRASDPLDSDINGPAGICASGQHLAFTGRYQIALKLFVDRHSPKRRALALVLPLRTYLHFKPSARLSR